MATSKISNYPADRTVLHPGQEVASNAGTVSFPGILTGGRKTIYITVPISYYTGLIPHSVSVTPNEMNGSLRGVNGYLRNDLANTDLLSVSDCTVTVIKAGWNFNITITFTNELTNAVNNSPVMYTGTLKFNAPTSN